MIKAFTDYPFTELGDTSGQLAPVRQVTVKGWDGDKYVTIEVEGKITTVKYGYLYSTPGRCGDVPALDIKLLESM
jgi:hypothetical protein